MKFGSTAVIALSLAANAANAQTVQAPKLPDLILNDVTTDSTTVDVASTSKAVQCAFNTVQNIDIPGSTIKMRQDEDGQYVIYKDRTVYVPAEQKEGVILNYDTPEAIHLNHKNVNTISVSAELDKKSQLISFMADHDGSYQEGIIDAARVGVGGKIKDNSLIERNTGATGELDSIQGKWAIAAVQTMEVKFTQCMGGALSSERPATAASEVGAAPIQGSSILLSTLNLKPGVYTGNPTLKLEP